MVLDPSRKTIGVSYDKEYFHEHEEAFDLRRDAVEYRVGVGS
jgi:hypothetical protein